MRQIEVTRSYADFTFRWKATWIDEAGCTYIGLAYTKRAAIRNLRHEIGKQQRSKRREIVWTETVPW